jgi:VWFA-related protein
MMGIRPNNLPGVVALLTLALSGHLSGQQAPTFRTGTEQVPVNVSVLASDGRPVDDLTAADFVLEVDGRPRTITTATYVRTSRLDTPQANDQRTFSTNAGQRPGRLIALVIDEAHITRGTTRAAFQAASAFVASLDRADRVALYLIPGAGPVSGFTSNHALIQRLLATASGQSSDATTSSRIGIAESFDILDRPPSADNPTSVAPGSRLDEVLSRECAGERDAAQLATCRRMVESEARSVFADTRARTSRSLIALRGLLDQWANTPDSKTVVLVSEGIVLGRDMSDITWVGGAVSRAHVSLHALRLSGGATDAGAGRLSPSLRADQDLMADGMDQLVGSARGTVAPVAVNAAAVFSRLSLELSGYYLLSFAPEPSERDGRSHRIAVRTTRRGVTVRARQEFSMPATRPATRQEFLLDALKSTTLLSDFTVSATTLSYPSEKPQSLKVLLGIALDRTFNPRGPFALAWYITDAKGKVVSLQDMKVVEASSPAAGDATQVVAEAVLLEPGVYNLTVAAVDDEGRKATVEHGFEARLTNVGQLRLSDVLLAPPPAAGAAVSPSVDGRITRDAVVAYAEIASQAEPQLASAGLTLEIAKTEDGPTLDASPLRLTPSEAPGIRRAETRAPLALLPDGDYIARLVLTQNGRAIGRTVRPFTLARGTATAPAAGMPSNTAAGSPTPAAAVPIPIDAFDRAAVLSRASVGFFLDRLVPVGRPPLPDALLPALGLARAARFDQSAEIARTSGVQHHAVPFFTGLDALARGDLNRAAEDFGAALALAPDLAPAAFYLGACYAAAGRDRDAALAWRSALITDARAPWIHTALIDAWLRTRDLPLALDLLRTSVAEWPADVTLAQRAGLAAAMSGQPVDAVRALTRWTDAHPDDHPRLLVVLRMLYEARAAGLSVDSVNGDRVLFAKLATQYTSAGGPQITQVAAWKQVMDRDPGGS